MRVLASRISYVGDLGWELYAPMEQGQALWDVLWEAGQPHGLVPAGIGVYGTTGRLEKGYRLFGAELESEYTVVEAGMQRPKVKDAEFVGTEAHLRHRDEEPAALLCTLTVDDHSASNGVKRYMLGREPILTPDGERIVDRKGRGSYVTSAGSGPSVGKHLLLAYLPPEHAVEGTSLLVQYMGERYPVTVAVAGSRPLFDPGERARPLLMNVARLRQARARDGRADHAHGRRAGDRHELPRLHDRPHEECAVEEALADRRDDDGAHARAARGRGAAPERARDGDRLRGPARGGRRGLGPRGDGGRDRRRRARAVRSTCSSSATSRPTPAATRSAVRVAHALGLPCVTGIKRLGRRRRRRGRGREAGGGWEIFELPLPAVVTVKEGINLPRYPSLPGRLRAKKATIEPAR